MVVGAIVWELEILGAQSLKDKRRVVNSLKERLQSRFRVSAAETRHHDVWQRAELAACMVTAEHHHASDVLDTLDRFIVSDLRVRVISSRRSYH